jgi:hypothetical protein
MSNTSNPSYSSLAALSARHSFKRARVLYAIDPQSAFIPSTDPTILQASLNRRKQRMSGVAPKRQQQQGQTSDALAIVTEDYADNSTTIQMKPVASERTSTALTVQGGTSQGDETKKSAGILVVRWTEEEMLNCIVAAY